MCRYYTKPIPADKGRKVMCLALVEARLVFASAPTGPRHTAVGASPRLRDHYHALAPQGRHHFLASIPSPYISRRPHAVGSHPRLYHVVPTGPFVPLHFRG